MLTGGERHDLIGFAGVYAQARAVARPVQAIMDRADDTNAIRATIRADRVRSVIPPKATRLTPARYSKAEYRKRNGVERLINRLKHFRRIATRYDKLAATFLASIQLVLTFLLLKNS